MDQTHVDLKRKESLWRGSSRQLGLVDYMYKLMNYNVIVDHTVTILDTCIVHTVE